MDHKNELYNEFIAYYEQIMGFEPNYILNKCASFQIKREALVKSRHLLKNIILLRFLKTRKAPKVQCNISHDTNMVK